MNEDSNRRIEENIQSYFKQYELLRAIGKKQEEKLGLVKDEYGSPAEITNLFISVLVRTFWSLGDFAISLKDSNNSAFASLPVRTAMEIALKIEKLSKVDIGERHLIAVKELLRIYARVYELRLEKIGLESQDEDKILKGFKKYYNLLNGSLSRPFDEIDKVRPDNELHGFRRYREIIEDCFSKELSKSIYRSYQDLCESAHAGYMNILMRLSNDKGEYSRSLAHLIAACSLLLPPVDKILYGKIQPETKEALAIVQRLNQRIRMQPPL